MKKTLNVLLSAVIIITLLFAYALPASAEEITLGAAMYKAPVLNTNAALYYSQLINYFGYNVKGTCSHNALALLLTFYDTYHNDDYVHESLDYQAENELYGSPGTLYENDLYEEFVVQGGASYYNFIYQYSLSSLHLYLIELAMDMGLYEDENGVSTLPENPNAVSLGLYEDQIIALLEEYLSRRHNSMCDRTVVMHESCLDFSQDQLVRTIAEKIEQGIPVMIWGTIDMNCNKKICFSLENIKITLFSQKK